MHAKPLAYSLLKIIQTFVNLVFLTEGDISNVTVQKKAMKNCSVVISESFEAALYIYVCIYRCIYMFFADTPLVLVVFI